MELNDGLIYSLKNWIVCATWMTAWTKGLRKEKQGMFGESGKDFIYGVI